MRLVMTDNDYDDAKLEERLAAEAGVEFACFGSRAGDDIVKNAEGADGLITSYGDFCAETIVRLPQSVRVISRSGTGFDSVDVAAATARGIAVCNVTGYGTEVVSDHAIALAMDCLRQVSATDRALRDGTWSYQQARPLGQCAGRVFGVIGMGAIGSAAARKARGLGFDVVCWSRSLEPGGTTPEGAHALGLEELLACADVVSVHCALAPETFHLLDAERLALMKPSAVVVNTSRGAVIDTVALAEALCEGRLWGAGIDVYEEEPVPRDHPLLSAPRCVLTPHTAYWSEESGLELRRRTFGNALAVLRGEPCPNVLNPQVLG